MKIWTGKICLLYSFVGLLVLAGCSSTERNPGGSNEREVSLREDRKAVEELRKDIPEEKRKDNDRLAEMLERWKAQKTSPEVLRERFDGELTKRRAALEKKTSRAREDFNRSQSDKRSNFQKKQKEEREDYLSKKPNSDARSDFSNRQSTERDRFNADIRDERDSFEDKIKEERRDFEDDVKARWSEFRQEFPEYSRNYREMKEQEEKAKEEARENPKPYGGWPYKDSHEVAAPPSGGSATGPSAGNPSGGKPGQEDPNADVNKGGNGWPATDPSEFDRIPRGKPQGN